MEKIRKPFQGVGNIIRFNWHFYVLSVGLVFLLLLIIHYVDAALQFYMHLIFFLILVPIITSLFVSYYIYDLSGLYKLDWIVDERYSQLNVVNINAGFDETSILLKQKYANSKITVFDFYHPSKHTEVSIKRARKIYSTFPGAKQVSTNKLPLKDKSIDTVFVMFAAHEIRNWGERVEFFNELRRIVKSTGQIIIAEHLRDGSNFLAYNIGFLHFYSKSSWHKVFQITELEIQNEIKITPFISAFILKINGDTL